MQKAIGWALCDYSKTNALFVKEQLTKEWATLTRREASIYKKVRRLKNET